MHHIMLIVSSELSCIQQTSPQKTRYTQKDNYFFEIYTKHQLKTIKKSVQHAILHSIVSASLQNSLLHTYLIYFLRPYLFSVEDLLT